MTRLSSFIAPDVNTTSRFDYTATSGQTTFTGADDDGSVLLYQGGFIDVYLNGVRLIDGTDFTTTSDGDSIVLTSPAASGDILSIVAYGVFDLANHYTQTESDNRYLRPDTVEPTFTGTAALGIPTGTTSERPVTASVGQFRFNADEQAFEGYDGSVWSSIGSGEKGTLTKTFVTGESASINLSDSVLVPVVSATKEVGQTGVTNNDWDVESNGDNYTLHDTAYNTTLTPSNATGNGTFTLGSGAFAAEDLGKRIVGNGGEAILIGTDGTYELQVNFNDTSTISAGDWNMFALDLESAELGLKLSGYLSDSTLSTHDIFSDNSIVATYNFDGNANDLGGSYNGTWVGTENYVNGQYGQAANFNGVDSYIQVNSSFGTVFDYSNRYTISLWLIGTDQINLNFGNSQGNTGLSCRSGGGSGRIYISKPDNSSGNRFLYDFPAGFEAGDHAVIVKTGDETLDFYKNGSFMATWSPTTTGVGNNGDNTIGLGLSEYVDGSYDQFRIFNRALSTSEIDALYNEESITFATDQYTTAITTLSTDTEFWTDINSMTADDSSNDGSVYYAVSTDDRTTWKIIDDTNGERNIVRNNGGTWEYNSDTTYGSETWVVSTENDEFYAIEESTSVATNQMNATQLNAVSDANHYTLGNDLDLAITMFMADGGAISPTSDGVAINYDAQVKNVGAILGADYEWDAPTNSIVRITSLADQNLKVRVV